MRGLSSARITKTVNAKRNQVAAGLIILNVYLSAKLIDTSTNADKQLGESARIAHPMLGQECSGPMNPQGLVHLSGRETTPWQTLVQDCLPDLLYCVPFHLGILRDFDK
jgi:hypothetical protein